MTSAVTVTGARELIAALDKATSRAWPEADKILAKGAVNIKKDWQQRWSGHAHFKALPAAISYDLFHTLFGSSRVEVGPDKSRRQGALGNIIEFGTENNAPIPGGLPALKTEAPRFERALLDLGTRLVER